MKMSWQNKKAGDVRSRVNIYRQMLSAVVTTQTNKHDHHIELTSSRPDHF